MTKRRYWVSWWEPAFGGDSRPLYVPTPDAVPCFWSTGERTSPTGMVQHSVCAVVQADSQTEAFFTILRYWYLGELRFIEEKSADWMPESSRFPMAVAS